MGFPKTGLFDGFIRSHSDGRRWRYNSTKGVWKIKQEIDLDDDDKYNGADGSDGLNGINGIDGVNGADGYPFSQEDVASSTTTTLTLGTGGWCKYYTSNHTKLSVFVIILCIR
jgi:hypothetical protein